MKRVIKQLCKPLPILGACGALLVASSVLAFEGKPDPNAAPKGKALNLPVDETPVQRSSSASGSFAPIVKKVAPTVVKIVTTVKSESGEDQQIPGFGFDQQDPFWRHFFGI